MNVRQSVLEGFALDSSLWCRVVSWLAGCRVLLREGLDRGDCHYCFCPDWLAVL